MGAVHIVTLIEGYEAAKDIPTEEHYRRLLLEEENNIEEILEELNQEQKAFIELVAEERLGEEYHALRRIEEEEYHPYLQESKKVTSQWPTDKKALEEDIRKMEEFHERLAPLFEAREGRTPDTRWIDVRLDEDGAELIYDPSLPHPFLYMWNMYWWHYIHDKEYGG